MEESGPCALFPKEQKNTLLKGIGLERHGFVLASNGRVDFGAWQGGVLADCGRAKDDPICSSTTSSCFARR
jgi:hypothetical protein